MTVILQQHHALQYFDTCQTFSNMYLQPSDEYRKYHINTQIKTMLNMVLQITFVNRLYANKGHMLIAELL